MTNIINIITTKFDNNINTDLITYNNLSDNGKQVFTLFNKYAHTQPQKLLTLDITELSYTLCKTPEQFMDGVNEIIAQNYFMYKDTKGIYVFANSRMVF